MYGSTYHIKEIESIVFISWLIYLIMENTGNTLEKPYKYTVRVHLHVYLHMYIHMTMYNVHVQVQVHVHCTCLLM